jgi:PhzF family phenazine biosynthesis protein
MASRVPFYFVDVFATGPLTGNPLSLVPDADGLDEARMRAIAREFNQSETTFLLRPSLPGATQQDCRLGLRAARSRRRLRLGRSGRNTDRVAR